MQVGNAVAIPVALALGYSFGLASQGLSDDNPLTELPISSLIVLHLFRLSIEAF